MFVGGLFMKKTRNAFFSESSFQSYNPNINTMGAGMNQMQPQMPFQSGSNYFYQGPMPNNYNTNMNSNDIESRLAKIERQLNRMDYRLSKLENGTTNISTTEDYEINNSNMYML